ncbi:hypothetical protein PHMEG_00041748 [Phytophthora megakarya]|uniref:Eukaryotic/viral aspartic protease n=1 Tax=Phytophthora megakarya TaxID=4795 RepID=A0A225UB42_9STRA|nr:hypothetical protein PHMEG_00041748 [Phytophthora megakarya]
MRGAFSASELFDLETTVIHRSATWICRTAGDDQTSSRSPEYQTESSQYASATSNAGSDSSVDLQHLTLGPSGAAMLRERQANPNPGRSSCEWTVVTPARRPEEMQTFFNAAMNRYLKEKQTGGSKPRWVGPTRTRRGVGVRRVISRLTRREYSGKDQDKDRARSWLGKVKSVFVRDQVPDSVWCWAIYSRVQRATGINS